MAGTRDQNVFMARLAEQADRFEDMVTYMGRVAQMGGSLNVEERNLLSVAFKNAVGARRSSWRAITLEMHEKDHSTKPCVLTYKGQVEKELNDKCDEILQMLTKDTSEGLIRTSIETNDKGAQVFYRKMEGDYHRYKAEFSTSPERDLHAKNAFEAYTKATQVATEAMIASHPIRLGLALNFSVFYYEVYGNNEYACQLAQTAYDSAGGDAAQDGTDAGAILQLLKDNLMLWRADATQGEGRPPEQDGTLCEDL